VKIELNPQEVREVLEQLLRANADPKNTLAGVLSNEHVAAISQAITNLDARWQGQPKKRSAK
jgi:hypothetical protein